MIPYSMKIHIIDSKSDGNVANKAVKILKKFDIPYELTVASAPPDYIKKLLKIAMQTCL